MMPTRLGSAMPCPTRYLTPHVMSSCIFWPHSLLPAFRNFLPKPVDARKFGCRTAYPRFAQNCAHGLYPHESRAHGPPCGMTSRGRFLPDVPFGIVRYAGISRPSDDL